MFAHVWSIEIVAVHRKAERFEGKQLVQKCSCWNITGREFSPMYTVAHKLYLFISVVLKLQIQNIFFYTVLEKHCFASFNLHISES